MSANKNKEAMFRISEIRKISHFENDFHDYGLKEKDIKNITFKLNLELDIDCDNSKISQRVKCTFHNDNNDEQRLFGIETITSFILKNFNNVVTKKDCDEYNLPDGLVELFLDISMSHTRGMLAALNTNSIYQKTVLPLIDPKEILKNSNIQKVG